MPVTIFVDPGVGGLEILGCKSKACYVWLLEKGLQGQETAAGITHTETVQPPLRADVYHVYSQADCAQWTAHFWDPPRAWGSGALVTDGAGDFTGVGRLRAFPGPF